MEDIYTMISELGFPVAAAIALGGGFWFTLKWLMNNVLGEIREVQDGLSQAQSELMNKLNATQQEQYTILVKLIDRVRSLEDAITSVEIMTRTAYNLEQDWGRVGKAQDQLDKNK